MFLTSGMDEEDVSFMTSILYVCWLSCNTEMPLTFACTFWYINPYCFLCWQNKTGIIDLDGHRCFVMPLNRQRVLPPRSLFDLIRKMWDGMCIV